MKVARLFPPPQATSQRAESLGRSAQARQVEQARRDAGQARFASPSLV